LSHLSDEEIQIYLDGSPLDASAVDHLQKCQRCRRALTAYQLVYAGLADQSVFSMPRGLAPAVLSRLGLDRPRRRWMPSPEIALAGGGVVTAVAAVLVLFGLSPFLHILGAMGLALVESLSAPLELTRTHLLRINHYPTVALWGLAVVFLASAADRLLVPRLYGGGKGQRK
jgi:predicted anti-sigma-YlaC factor YlaD